MSLKCILQGQDSKNLATKEELNQHIEDKSNPHEVTAEQVGATPYVGSYNITSDTELDNALDDIISKVQQGPTVFANINIGAGNVSLLGGSWSIRVHAITENAVDIIATCYSVAGAPMTIRTRTKMNGVYSAWKTLANDAAIVEALAKKAPAGYGLGTSAAILTSADNIDTLMANGWFTYNKDNAPQGTLPSDLIPYATLICVSVSGQTCVQEAFDPTDSDLHGTVLRRTIYGISGKYVYPWEYVNPPFRIGTEYRTTERYNLQAVYKKVDTDGIIKWRLENETEWKPEAEYLGTSGSQNPVFLKRVTTSADATSISIDVSDINFDDYYEVVMYTNLFDTSSYRSSTPMCLMRINNVSSTKYGFSNGTNTSGSIANFRYIYQGALLNTGKYTSSPCKVYIRKKDSMIFVYGSYTYVNLVDETYNHTAEVFGEYMLGTSDTFSSLQIDVEASNYATIRTGSVIEFWGYKK